MKQEVVWQKLYDSVNGKVMQTDHPLLKLIKNSPKRSLFLIGMVVTSGLTTDSIITDTSVDGESNILIHIWKICTPPPCPSPIKFAAEALIYKITPPVILCHITLGSQSQRL